MSYPFPQQDSSITSEFADDPDMGELIELFLEELPARLKALSDAWAAGDLQTIQRITHQLRGSSAGYGFSTLGTAGGEIEDLIRGSTPPLSSPTPALEALIRQFESIGARVMNGAKRKAA